MSKNLIHPSSVVSETSKIGDNVKIGPFCYVGKNVKLGPDCTLHSHVVLDGNLSIGANCEIFPFACIGKKTQDLKYEGGSSYVEIGNRCVIREYVTVNSATKNNGKTILGNECLIQSYCHIAHECILGDKIIMSSGAMLSGHVEIDHYAVIGGYVGVVQFVKIGKMAMVGGYSKLTQDVLPFCIADGVPAETRLINKIGMERNGMSSQEIKIVTEAFKKILRSTKGLDQVVRDLELKYPKSPEVKTMLNFIKKSERGLARPKITRKL